MSEQTSIDEALTDSRPVLLIGINKQQLIDHEIPDQHDGDRLAPCAKCEAEMWIGPKLIEASKTMEQPIICSLCATSIGAGKVRHLGGGKG